MTRDQMIEFLKNDGWVVEPWGRVGLGTFLIVRTGGVIGTRPVHEVWLVGPALGSEYDPDAGMQAAAERLYEALTTVLSEVDITPGASYAPNRREHPTMIATGVHTFAGLQGAL